ncbi:MAG: hypothetical protein Q8R98_22565 [Rubrivivax sp.]|nr:hypothetical protein [Rubrivivax sp.]MDP3614635.1 hypothetical protein [Rubrivivax sp.]
MKVALESSRTVFAAPEDAAWSDSDQWENLFTATEQRVRGGAEKVGAIT